MFIFYLNVLALIQENLTYVRFIPFYQFFVKSAMVVYMDRTVETRVGPVSTTPSVITSPVAVYRGVVLGIREISVQKVY